MKFSSRGQDLKIDKKKKAQIKSLFHNFSLKRVEKFFLTLLKWLKIVNSFIALFNGLSLCITSTETKQIKYEGNKQRAYLKNDKKQQR